ncbi:MAG: hypothetical protein ACLVG5_07595 [Clostridium sp.]
MSASAVLRTRKLVTGFSIKELQAVAEKAMSFATAASGSLYERIYGKMTD